MCVTSQLQKLERELLAQERYIKYLYSQIDGYETEIEDLRRKNSELRYKLRNALNSSTLKEEACQSLEQQLIEVENVNIQLKERIREYHSKMAAPSHRDVADVFEALDNQQLSDF